MKSFFFLNFQILAKFCKTLNKKNRVVFINLIKNGYEIELNNYYMLFSKKEKKKPYHYFVLSTWILGSQKEKKIQVIS